MYPKYPVSGTIRALLKGPLGGPGWVWGLGAQGSGVHSRTCLAKLLLLKLYRVSGLWPHGSGLAETLVLVLLPLRVACPTSNWKSSLTSTCYAQGGGPLLSSSSMVYFYIYISLSLSLSSPTQSLQLGCSVQTRGRLQAASSMSSSACSWSSSSGSSWSSCVEKIRDPEYGADPLLNCTRTFEGIPLNHGSSYNDSQSGCVRLASSSSSSSASSSSSSMQKDKGACVCAPAELDTFRCKSGPKR